MNLWAKTLGRLAVLAVALFFFSCEDETSLLGFKSPKPKFNVSYVELPLESSVMLIDSVRTSNFYLSSETNRFLVGKYADNKMGEVTATAYTQFFTSSTSKSLLDETAVFDSVSLQLGLDYYNYGGTGRTVQDISIHELSEELIYDSLPYYFNKTQTSYLSTPLGVKSFAVDPAELQQYIDDSKDTVLTITMPLSFDFGKRIFNSAMAYRNSSTAGDSVFVRPDDFTKEFKGIAIVADNGDKVVGFTPSSTYSKIILHYHDADTDSLELNLTFPSGLVSYNQIKSDRSASELAGLTNYHTDFYPDDNLRYVQAGTGIVTKLDFQKFYDFADADSNANMVINSAELIISQTEPSDVYKPISNMMLLATNENNRFKKLADPDTDKAQYQADSAALGAYKGYLGTTSGYFTIIGESNQLFTLSKKSDEDTYNGFLTLFAQQMFFKNPLKPRYRYFTLFPQSPDNGKSVNRIIFDKDKIKLRIYYTRPNDTNL